MLREFKPALIFLAKYLLLYVALNTAYGFFIENFRPDADPVTITVTRQTTGLLGLFYQGVECRVVDNSVNVPILIDQSTVIEVFEGCNSINVIIVFVCFLVAFKGPFPRFIAFLIGGVILIYLINLVRVAGLFMIAHHIPESLYFFHKYLFTGMIYLVVFSLWYFWIKLVKRAAIQA